MILTPFVLMTLAQPAPAPLDLRTEVERAAAQLKYFPTDDFLFDRHEERLIPKDWQASWLAAYRTISMGVQAPRADILALLKHENPTVRTLALGILYHQEDPKNIEPIASVTPFSPGALQRGLAGLLVSLIRLRNMEFNPNEAASRIQASDPYVQDAINTIVQRAELVGDGTAVADYCRAQLQSKVDLWQADAQNVTGGRTLTYAQPRGGSDGPKRGTTVSLLRQPGLEKWEEFTCLNSLREVEPSIKLIVDDGGLDDISDQPPGQEQAPPQQEGGQP